MAKQEILLIQDVLKLGNMGDVVKVAPGYARNHLFPYRKGIPLDQAHKRQIEVLRERASKNEAEREAKALVLKKTVDGMTIQVAARVAHELELFGSIGTREIVAALAAKGIHVDGKQVHLTDKIRRLGIYPIEVKLARTVTASITLEVVNSDPTAPSLKELLAQVAAERERIKAAKDKPKEGEAADAGSEGGAESAKQADKPSKGEKPTKTEKPDKAEKVEKAEKGGKSEKPAKAEKQEKAEKAGKKKG